MSNDTNEMAKIDLYPEQTFSFREEPLSIADERLHPAADENDASSTETSYYGFNIPEHNINGEIYHWFHPVTNLCTGGVWVWQGNKSNMLEAEYFNYPIFNQRPVEGDLDDWTSPLGLRHKVVEVGIDLS